MNQENAVDISDDHFTKFKFSFSYLILDANLVMYKLETLSQRGIGLF